MGISDANLKLIIEGIDNVSFSEDIVLSPKKSKQSFYINCNSIKSPFEDENLPTFTNSEYVDVDQYNNLKLNENCSFSVAHLNIASLSKHIDDLQCLLSLLTYPFDVIGLSEHKIRGESVPINNINIPGYNFCYDATKSSHGGTGFFLSSKFSFHKIDDLNIALPGSLESTFVEIIIPNSQNIICGCIYKHPHMSISDFNDNYFEPLLDKINQMNKKCIIMGDFNIDLIKANTKQIINDFFNTVTSRYFSPFILQPTRITETSKTLIDNIFFNSLEYETHSGNLTVQISDHLIQYLTIKNFKKPLPCNNKHNLYKRNYSQFKKEEFELELSQVDWRNIINHNIMDINNNFNNFFKTLETLLDVHAPLKKLTRKEYTFKSKPWISKKIQSLMIKRDKIFIKYCKEKNDTAKSKLFHDYKNFRNKVVFEIKSSKTSYFSKYFIDNNNNISNIWKGINSLIAIKSRPGSVPTTLKKDNSEVSSPKELAELFNSYFVNIGPQLANKISKSNNQFTKFFEESSY